MGLIAFQGMKPFRQLLFSLFVILVSFLVFLFIATLAAIPFFGFNSVLNLGGDLNDPENLRLLKYFQVVQSVGLFIVPPFILAWLFHGKISEYLFLEQKSSVSSVFLTILLVFVSLPVINLAGVWNSGMDFPDFLEGVERWMKNAEDQATELTEAFLEVNTMRGLLFSLFMMAFLPAIGEELLFRGILQRIFTRWTRSHHWGIWITAILFSAMHIQFYGFVPRMLLGVMFGYLLVWSGSMWLPIAAHFFNNSFAILSIFLMDRNLLNPSIEEFGTDTTLYASVVSLALIFILLYFIKKENRENGLKLISP